MTTFIFYFITLVLFNVTLATETKVCSFPGIPYGGRMDSKLEEWTMGKTEYIHHSRLTYQIGQTVQYDCYAPGRIFRFEGNDRLHCKENGKWEGELPQCVENAAYKRAAYISTDKVLELTDGLKDPIQESVVCPAMPNGPDHFVRVDVGRPCSIKEIDIYFSNEQPIDLLNNLVLEIEGSGRTGQCHRSSSVPDGAISNYARYDCTLLNVSVVSELLIRFLHLKTELKICEIEVYVRQKEECGYPEVPANGRVSMPSGRHIVTYNCLPGYELNGPDERKCENGQWTKYTPHCMPVGSSNGGETNALSFAQTNDAVEVDNSVIKNANSINRIENLVSNERNNEGKDEMIDEFQKEISSVLETVEAEVKELESAANNLWLVVLLSILLVILVVALVFTILFVVKRDLAVKILLKMGINSEKLLNMIIEQENQPLNVT